MEWDVGATAGRREPQAPPPPSGLRLKSREASVGQAILPNAAYFSQNLAFGKNCGAPSKISLGGGWIPLFHQRLGVEASAG